jgi:hypothetical protein
MHDRIAAGARASFDAGHGARDRHGYQPPRTAGIRGLAENDTVLGAPYTAPRRLSRGGDGPRHDGDRHAGLHRAAFRVVSLFALPEPSRRSFEAAVLRRAVAGPSVRPVVRGEGCRRDSRSRVLTPTARGSHERRSGPRAASAVFASPPDRATGMAVARGRHVQCNGEVHASHGAEDRQACCGGARNGALPHRDAACLRADHHSHVRRRKSAGQRGRRRQSR